MDKLRKLVQIRGLSDLTDKDTVDIMAVSWCHSMCVFINVPAPFSKWPKAADGKCREI